MNRSVKLSSWLAAVCLSCTVSASLPDPEKAWRDYAARQNKSKPSRTFPYQNCFERAAAAHQLPVTLLLAVARGESDFDAAAISQANAFGLMQIQWPGTGRHLGIRNQANLFDPCTNAEAGARYLRELIDRYNGDIHLALAAYNYGPSRVKAGVVPEGAAWYSGYIYRHLQYVTGAKSGNSASRKYQLEDRLVVISFTSATRARRLLEWLEINYPDLQLEWFRAPLGRHQLVLRHSSAEQLQKGLQQLAIAGLVIDQETASKE